MRRYLVTIAYDGTRYSGWQIQKKTLSVQEVLEKNLSLILQKKIKITGSGRTDAKAHAYGQVAHFDIDSPFDTDRFLHSLNRLLPHDIKILNLYEVSNKFHARYSAISKVYHYYIHTDPILSPFLRDYRYHFPYLVDIDLMRAASLKLLGKRNFTSFCNKGSSNQRPVKNMKRIDISKQCGGIRLAFEADGFLYKMVRNLTTLLLQAATSKIPLDEIDTILHAKDRRCAPNASPANALFLVKVHYPSGLDKRIDGTKIAQKPKKRSKGGKKRELLSIPSS